MSQMIESIKLSNIATYQASQYLNGLSQFNFIFGGNGSGKTTITRVIADESKFPSCAIKWKDDVPLKTMVYNRLFVVKNFNQSDEIKGVFTLGSQDIALKQAISDKKTALMQIQYDINNLILQLYGDGKKVGITSELAAVEEKLKEDCWAVYTKYKTTPLVHAFQGVKSSKEKFKTQIVNISQSKKDYSSPINITLLQEHMGVVFGEDLILESSIPDLALEIANLIKYESDNILKKRVVGKNDVDIAAMIQHLGNSDWIKMGRAYYEQNDHKTCPFCQQQTTEQLTYQLNEYFDEAYNSDIKALDELISRYQADASKLQQTLDHILNYPSQFIDIAALRNHKQFLDACLMLNIRRLFSKKQEPSQLIELEPIGTILSNIKDLIHFANTQIDEHNKLINNRSSEKLNLSTLVWAYIVGVELQVKLAKYHHRKAGLLQMLATLNQQLHEYEASKNRILVEIANLEKQTSSILPTIEAMNNILYASGFQGFSFAQADGEIAAYKLVRSDGSDAKKTLSEGEKTFITFLYFYHLIKGSHSETGTAENRVVVFDDPVASLDNDVLFIVSNLIKNIISQVRNQTDYIKQVFVLTHNIYFYNEVTFNTKRAPNSLLKEETFWIVRKLDLVSRLEKQSFNPIKNSYDLLWSEIRDKKYSNLNIQNILRRILKHYFKLSGELDFKQLCELFEGHEKIICHTLTSQFYEVSHFLHDDTQVSNQSDATTKIYLLVFKAIFEKSGHIKHYEMMMRTSNQES
jgi:wobble nucleotide-excising tRNase